MVYAATMSEYQIFMHWKIIIEYFGPNIQNIYVVGNIVVEIISILSSVTNNQHEPSFRRTQFQGMGVFANRHHTSHGDCFLLDISLLQIEGSEE